MGHGVQVPWDPASGGAQEAARVSDGQALALLPPCQAGVESSSATAAAQSACSSSRATSSSIALYPTAVKDLDYKSLDVFVNRLLNRITGCSQRFTSATFLRAELGVPSSKYLAHMRALCYAWKLANTCWFKDSLLAMHGDGPLQRVVNLMYEYGLVKRTRSTVQGKAIRSTEQEKADAIAKLRGFTSEKWKAEVKKAVLAVAAVKLQEDLDKKGLGLRMSPEPLVAPRPYVRLGGYKACYGVHWRWSLMKQHHQRFRPEGEPFLQEPRYEASGDLPAVRSLAEMMEKDECFPLQHDRFLIIIYASSIIY